jgi:hypothetical protein
MCVLILTKYGLDYILLDFFTDSSGHPGFQQGDQKYLAWKLTNVVCKCQSVLLTYNLQLLNWLVNHFTENDLCLQTVDMLGTFFPQNDEIPVTLAAAEAAFSSKGYEDK